MAKTSSGFDLDILKKQIAGATPEQLQKSYANVDKFAKGDAQVKGLYAQALGVNPQVQAPPVQPMQQPVQQPVQNTQSIIDQIRQQKLQKQRDTIMQGIESQRQRSQAASQAEQQALGQKALQQRSRIGVEDVMSRTARDKGLAQGGLSTSGAKYQGDISQNVLTQGSLGQNRATEQQGLQDIGRRQSDYESQLNQQGLQAITSAEAQGMDFQLQDLLAQQNAEREATATESERAFTLSRDEQDRAFTLARDEAQNLSVQQRDLLQADLEREQTFLDAQIQQARDKGLFEQERQLNTEKQKNAIQLEGIRKANESILIGQRGAENRATSQFDASLRQTTQATQEPAFDIKTWKTAFDRINDQATTTNVDGQKVTNDAKRQFDLARELINNVMSKRMTEQQAAQLVIEYGIDERYVQQAEDLASGIVDLNPRR